MTKVADWTSYIALSAPAADALKSKIPIALSASLISIALTVSSQPSLAASDTEIGSPGINGQDGVIAGVPGTIGGAGRFGHGCSRGRS